MHKKNGDIENRLKGISINKHLYYQEGGKERRVEISIHKGFK